MPTMPSGVGTVIKNGGSKGGSFWKTTGFMGSMDSAAYILALDRGMGQYTVGFAQQVQDYAQQHAPWEDRTGDARDGLTAQGQQRLTEYRIILYHTVDYGIWLEVRWNGKYAIIIPTLLTMGHELMNHLSVMMAGGAAVELAL